MKYSPNLSSERHLRTVPVWCRVFVFLNSYICTLQVSNNTHSNSFHSAKPKNISFVCYCQGMERVGLSQPSFFPPPPPFFNLRWSLKCINWRRNKENLWIRFLGSLVLFNKKITYWSLAKPSQLVSHSSNTRSSSLLLRYLFIIFKG